jgi:hypothetical protein
MLFSLEVKEINRVKADQQDITFRLISSAYVELEMPDGARYTVELESLKIIITRCYRHLK